MYTDSFYKPIAIRFSVRRRHRVFAHPERSSAESRSSIVPLPIILQLYTYVYRVPHKGSIQSDTSRANIDNQILVF